MSVRRAGSPDEVAAQKKAQRLEVRNNRDDLSKILATPEGERYMLRLLTRCGILRTGYEGNGSRAYFDAGMRHVGVMIASEVAAINPGLVTKVLSPLALEPPPEDTKDHDDHRE